MIISVGCAWYRDKIHCKHLFIGEVFKKLYFLASRRIRPLDLPIYLCSMLPSTCLHTCLDLLTSPSIPPPQFPRSTRCATSKSIESTSHTCPSQQGGCRAPLQSSSSAPASCWALHCLSSSTPLTSKEFRSRLSSHARLMYTCTRTSSLACPLICMIVCRI